MRKIVGLINEMESLRNSVVTTKQSMRKDIAELTRNIENAVSNGDSFLEERLTLKKEQLIEDYDYLNDIDKDNQFSYATLGYFVKGFSMKEERLKREGFQCEERVL